MATLSKGRVELLKDLLSPRPTTSKGPQKYFEIVEAGVTSWTALLNNYLFVI